MSAESRPTPPECPTCGKRQWPVIHSCVGVPGGSTRRQQMSGYDRDVLVDVLVYHYRVAPGKGCGCGWDHLGHSWPEHIATVFEESVAARMSPTEQPRDESETP